MRFSSKRSFLFSWRVRVVAVQRLKRHPPLDAVGFFQQASIQFSSKKNVCSIHYLYLANQMIKSSTMRFFTLVFCAVWSNFVMSQSIAFGSCHKVNDPNSDVILTSIADKNPDAFIWLGDIVYGKDGDPNTSANDLISSNQKKHTKSCGKPLRFMALGTTMIMASTTLDVTINTKTEVEPICLPS